jgi:hypothetical protein
MAEGGEQPFPEGSKFAGLVDEARFFETQEESTAGVTMLKEALLEKQLEEVEKERDELLAERDGLKKDLETQRADEADVYYYLHKKLDDNYDVIAGLEKQVLTEQTTRERAERAAKKTLDDLEASTGKTIKQLTSDLDAAQKQLEDLVEFKERKEELERLHALMVLEREEERRAQAEEKAALERDIVRGKERVKKEMVDKIMETKRNLLSMTEDNLNETTKRTIMENEQMGAELSYQARETEKMLKKNKKLVLQRNAFEIELQLSQDQERELAKRTQFYQKLIKKLHEKLKGRDEADGAREEAERADGMRLESVAEANQEVIAALQDKAAQLERNMEDVCLELERERALHSGAAGERDRMLALQDETTRFLLTAVKTMEGAEPAPGAAAAAAHEMERHRGMLQDLLAKFFAFQQAVKFKTEGHPEPPAMLALPPSDTRHARQQQQQQQQLSLPPLSSKAGAKAGRGGAMGGGAAGPQGLLDMMDRGELGAFGGDGLASTGPSPTARQGGHLFGSTRYNT